jgi:hypothetical protein
MTRILTPLGRRRCVALLISRAAWAGLATGGLIGAAAWVLI